MTFFFKLASRNNNENFSFLSKKNSGNAFKIPKENMVKLPAETYCLLFFCQLFSNTTSKKKSSELDQDKCCFNLHKTDSRTFQSAAFRLSEKLPVVVRRALPDYSVQEAGNRMTTHYL